MSDLTQTRLKELFKYSPRSGRWKRRVTTSYRSPAGEVTNGTLTVGGYTQLTIDGKRYLCHRLAYLYMKGSWPDQQIDHRDCCRSNNRWCNLRPATVSQNNRNGRKRRNNTSGYKGVYWHVSRQKWLSICWYRRKQHFLGYFDDPLDAYKAYCRFAKKHHKEFYRPK